MLIDKIDHIIQTYHTYLREKLPAIQEEVKVLDKSERFHKNWEQFKSHCDALEKLFVAHLLEEEVKLFPSMIKLEKSFEEKKELSPSAMEIQRFLQEAEKEHDQMMALVEAIESILQNLGLRHKSPKLLRMLIDFRRKFSKYITSEEYELFPEVRKIIQ